VQVNPQEWRERTDLTVKVGLGTGNEEDRQRKLMLVAQLQRDILGQMGMVEAPQAYALFADIAKAMGFDMPDKYAMSPQSPEFQQKMAQPRPNPALQVEQMKIQGAQQTTQMKLQADAQAEQARMQLDDMKHQREMQRRAELEVNKQEMQARDTALTKQLEAQERERDRQYEDMKHQREIEFRRWEAELRSATEIQKANMAQPVLNPATMAAEAEISREIQP